MQYNKYQNQYSDLDAQRKVLSQKVEDLKGAQIWYEKFELNAVALTSRNAKKSATEFNDEFRQLEPKVISKTSEVTKLNEQPSLGWSPKYWFSAERATAKADLEMGLADLSQLKNRVHFLKTQVKTQSDIVVRIENDLKKYEEHDSHLIDSKISALGMEIAELSAQLQLVEQRRLELDVQLSAPLAELKKLTSEKSSVASDLMQAQSMDDQMSSAANSYERAQLHERSKQTLGDPSPRKVKAAKERELEGIDRNIKKLETRLEAIAEKSSRLIRRLVIDGNNMCYLHSQRKFLGLRALRPVANALSEKYEVMIVFDASIREQLRKSTQEIIDCFSNRVCVHIVATGEKADESLLKIASEPGDWVISGDRFSEYPEMLAVRNKKLIRHEILEGKVLINDLSVEVGY